MKAYPFILVAAIVILPMALLAGAAKYIANHEQSLLQQRIQQLTTQRLEDINGSIVRHFEKLSRELRQLTDIDGFDVESLRDLNRREPRFLQLFVLSAKGDLVFPDPLQPLNANESQFLSRTSKMFTDMDLKTAMSLARKSNRTGKADDSRQTAPVKNLGRSLTQQFEDKYSGSDSAAPNSATASRATEFAEGWVVWYWDRGQNLIYWQRRPSGHLVGVALERARWMSDLIGELPETITSNESVAGKNSVDPGLRLVDATSVTVYEWGQVAEEVAHDKPFCEIPVAAPLAAWRLQCLVRQEYKSLGTGQSMQFVLWTGLFGTGVGLSSLAALLLRGYSRDMREASQQVSFVNHVSHELKTPLTNIRMYAELLERDLHELNSVESDRPRQRLKVIVSEGERLSRLISNVLTFARYRRKTLQPQLRPVKVSECIERIVDRFRPSLSAMNIDLQLSEETNKEYLLDPDFLEQILGNLISNVEKYAITGGYLGILCSLSKDMLKISVIDHGAGIPTQQSEAIFQPFKRLNNDIHYAAGTGIGLTIARELARLHGGDLRLLASQLGCEFEVQLKCARITP